ncbi:hypothetical protein B0H11DRAFT_2082963, partial [Mycena galericulata]
MLRRPPYRLLMWLIIQLTRGSKTSANTCHRPYLTSASESLSPFPTRPAPLSDTPQLQLSCCFGHVPPPFVLSTCPRRFSRRFDAPELTTTSPPVYQRVLYVYTPPSPSAFTYLQSGVYLHALNFLPFAAFNFHRFSFRLGGGIGLQTTCR